MPFLLPSLGTLLNSMFDRLFAVQKVQYTIFYLKKTRIYNRYQAEAICLQHGVSRRLLIAPGGFPGRTYRRVPLARQVPQAIYCKNTNGTVSRNDHCRQPFGRDTQYRVSLLCWESYTIRSSAWSHNLCRHSRHEYPMPCQPIRSEGPDQRQGREERRASSLRLPFSSPSFPSWPTAGRTRCRAS